MNREDKVLADIDALVDESLARGDDAAAGDWDERCPRCRCSWHGLPRGFCAGALATDEEAKEYRLGLMTGDPVARGLKTMRRTVELLESIGVSCTDHQVMSCTGTILCSDGNPNHAWERLSDNANRCTRCGVSMTITVEDEFERTNDQPLGPNWMVTYARGGGRWLGDGGRRGWGFGMADAPPPAQVALWHPGGD